MKRQCLLLLFGVIALSFAGRGYPQTWTENVYAITSPPAVHNEDLTSFEVLPRGDDYWFSQQLSHFVVTGSETQSPPWRALFGNLCNNSWWYSENFPNVPSNSGYIVNTVVYTTREGSNGFSGVNPTATALRNLDELVVEDLDFRFELPESEPGEGGGS